MFPFALNAEYKGHMFNNYYSNSGEIEFEQ